MKQSVIWKYEIPVDGETHHFQIPGGDVAECVRCESLTPGVVTIWLMLPVNALAVMTSFIVIGTGQEYPENWNFVGTCLDRQFVWHVFDRTGM